MEGGTDSRDGGATGKLFLRPGRNQPGRRLSSIAAASGPEDALGSQRFGVPAFQCLVKGDAPPALRQGMNSLATGGVLRTAEIVTHVSRSNLQ